MLRFCVSGTLHLCVCVCVSVKQVTHTRRGRRYEYGRAGHGDGVRTGCACVTKTWKVRGFAGWVVHTNTCIHA